MINKVVLIEENTMNDSCYIVNVKKISDIGISGAYFYMKYDDSYTSEIISNGLFPFSQISLLTVIK
jgi:hypothetical protein